jgi:hypothetical protein
MCADFTGPFVSKLTPTFGTRFPVGASLLAKGPLRPVENSRVNPLCLKFTRTGRLIAVAVSLLWASKVCLKGRGWQINASPLSRPLYPFRPLYPLILGVVPFSVYQSTSARLFMMANRLWGVSPWKWGILQIGIL